jgi:hypothetical protein
VPRKPSRARKTSVSESEARVADLFERLQAHGNAEIEAWNAQVVKMEAAWGAYRAHRVGRIQRANTVLGGLKDKLVDFGRVGQGRAPLYADRRPLADLYREGVAVLGDPIPEDDAAILAVLGAEVAAFLAESPALPPALPAPTEDDADELIEPEL